MKDSRKINAITIGNFLGDLFVVQFLFFLYALKGGILLGIFPAFISAVHIYVEAFYNKNPNAIHVDFKNTYTENFKRANLIGWLSALCLFVLYFDLRINAVYLDNTLVHIALSILMMIVLIVLTHLPIAILRFQLTRFAYFKQSLLVALANPLNTVSILIALFLLEVLFTRIGFFIFLFAPLLAIPIAWFGNHSVERIIQKSKEETHKKSKRNQ